MMKSDSKVSRIYPWVVVALLWVVALLQKWFMMMHWHLDILRDKLWLVLLVLLGRQSLAVSLDVLQ